MGELRFSEERIAKIRKEGLNSCTSDRMIADLMEAVNALEASQKAGEEAIEKLKWHQHEYLACDGTVGSITACPSSQLAEPTNSNAALFPSPAPCGTCGGTGYTQIAPNVRGLKPCPDCQKSCEDCGVDKGSCLAQGMIRGSKFYELKCWTPKSEKVSSQPQPGEKWLLEVEVVRVDDNGIRVFYGPQSFYINSLHLKRREE